MGMAKVTKDFIKVVEKGMNSGGLWSQTSNILKNSLLKCWNYDDFLIWRWFKVVKKV